MDASTFDNKSVKVGGVFGGHSYKLIPGNHQLDVASFLHLAKLVLQLGNLVTKPCGQLKL